VDIYLIRHGETVGNLSKVHQDASTELSELGKKQAEQLGKRLKSAKIDQIYASPMVRAQQTARIIAEQAKLEFSTLDDLREHQGPTMFAGRPHSDPELTPIKELIRANIQDPEWHHSDEENFHDLRARAQRILSMLEQESAEDILLVSHGNLIAMVSLYILLGDHLTGPMFADMKHTVTFTNTGITQCHFSPGKGWRIVTLNDTTHLS
jgi:broad specificity phosphatase PhoE